MWEHGFKINQPTDRPLSGPGTEPRAAHGRCRGVKAAPSQGFDSPARGGSGVGSRMAEIRGENEVWLPGPGEDHTPKKFKGET